MDFWGGGYVERVYVLFLSLKYYSTKYNCQSVFLPAVKSAAWLVHEQIREPHKPPSSTNSPPPTLVFKEKRHESPRELAGAGAARELPRESDMPQIGPQGALTTDPRHPLEPPQMRKCPKHRPFGAGLANPAEPCGGRAPVAAWVVEICESDDCGNSEGREWGVGSVVVESAFLGRPDFQSRGPKTLILKGFGAIWGKNLGRPKRSGKKKAHKHKLFCPVGLGTTPGLSRGFHRVCPWDKPGENLGQTRVSPYSTQWKPDFTGFVPGTNPVCPWDNPGDEGRHRKFM